MRTSLLLSSSFSWKENFCCLYLYRTCVNDQNKFGFDKIWCLFGNDSIDWNIYLWWDLQAKCTPDPSHKSHNAPDKYPTMHHFVTEMCTCVHISVTKWCIVGYGTDAFWDLWDGFPSPDKNFTGPRPSGQFKCHVLRPRKWQLLTVSKNWFTNSMGTFQDTNMTNEIKKNINWITGLPWYAF